MPWWGWLIAACVVWCSLLAAGVYLYGVRKASAMIAKVQEFDLGPSWRAVADRMSRHPEVNRIRDQVRDPYRRL